MTWQYIAGFFDGEGSVGLYGAHNGKVWTACRPKMYQITRGVLDEISRFLASEEIQCYTTGFSPKSGFSQRGYYTLTVSQLDAEKFLSKMLPFLVVKKVLVQDILRYRALWPKIEAGTKASRLLCREGAKCQQLTA